MTEDTLFPHEAGAGLSQPDEVEVLQGAAQHLGRLAGYFSVVAENIQGHSPELSQHALSLGRHTAYDLAHVIASAEFGDTAAARATLAKIALPSFHPSVEASAAKEFPDVPFYRGIITAEHIPAATPPSPEQAVTVTILTGNHIAINGAIFELKGAHLYMFNALLAYRDEPTDLDDLLSFGFPPSRHPASTLQRAGLVLHKLDGLLTSAVPGAVEMIQFGETRLKAQLSPLVVIKDMRNPSLTTELDSAITRSRTLNDIAKLADLRFSTVRALVTEEEMAARYQGVSKLQRFPGPVVDSILARCVEYKKLHKEREELPGETSLLGELVRALPGNHKLKRMTIARAARLLIDAGKEPYQLRVRERGNKLARERWCVRTEGVSELLLAALEADASAATVGPRPAPKETVRRTAGGKVVSHRPYPTAARAEADLKGLPYAARAAEVAERILQVSLKTADEVAAQISELGVKVTAGQVTAAADAEPLASLIDRNARFTPYAAKLLRNAFAPNKEAGLQSQVGDVEG